ncbi:MAG: hypothetical protein AW12_00798 [Candidatus Accumulibacter sp. BA-94]|nr:MAG: hypothetical protein AW12_00798 [Candidatus Accumulibacter sp. BA-94]
MRVDALHPAEQRVITFDFSDDLDASETLTGSISTDFATVMGVDPSPYISLNNGVATFGPGNKTVLLPIKSGLADRDYAITVACATTNPAKKLALVAHLPIREDS